MWGGADQPDTAFTPKMDINLPKLRKSLPSR